jgi:hypothetical protein
MAVFVDQMDILDENAYASSIPLGSLCFPSQRYPVLLP